MGQVQSQKDIPQVRIEGQDVKLDQNSRSLNAQKTRFMDNLSFSHPAKTHVSSCSIWNF